MTPEQQQHLWAPQNPPSPTMKVKLLCSFGGKILPRPSDGALRYVGGHNRIISVPKDIPFADLMARMADVGGPPGPAVFKYQLPSEGLDALISVSCAEDLDNMMDEYDKIAESAADGSAKIRVFLFSPAESSDAAGVGDLSDTGQRYFEAVNGVGGTSEGGGGSSSSVGSLKRKDSGLSAGTSNGGIDGVDGFGESPQTLNQGGGYLEPNQVQYMNTNVVNLAPLPVPAAQVSNRVAQPLSQLPPLPPAYQNVGGYGLNSTPVVVDFLLCQKMLPHVHSNSLAQNVGSGSPGTEASPVFYSQRSEDAQRARAPAPTSNLGDNVGEHKTEGQFGAYGFEGERPFAQKVENVDHASAFHPPPGSSAFLPDAQSSYGMFFGNFLQSRHEDPQVLQQQQQQQQQQVQQQWQQNVVSLHYPVRPEVISRPVPVGNDVGSVRNAEGSPQYANEYVRPINGMMEGLHLNPTAASGFNVQGNAVVMPDGSPLAVDGSPLAVDGTYGYMPQAGGNVMLPCRTFANSGIAQERNYVRPNDQMPPATVDHSHMHNFLAAEPGQVYTMAGNQGPFPHHLGVREPPIPSEGLLSMPAYTSGIDPTYRDRLVNQIPVGDLRDESSQLHFDHVAVPQSGNVLQSGNVPFGLSDTTSPTGLVETFQEPSPTDSLFCNQDPRKILGGARPLPPRPRRVSSREAIALKDPGVQVHLGNSTESKIIALLEEGGLHLSPDSLNKDLRLDAIQQVKVSRDEQIKQDLQAVAKGVSSSVLNSPLPPAPVFVDHDGREINNEFEDERRITEGNAESQRLDRKIEDNKPKAGLNISDDIGRLPVIKNSDIEELRELGSGTFGTVYHGKWRGTDVAIKRINDRCFAGKPSEQEKMRADFWNEACKLADLHHPNVVAFYGVVLDGPGGSVATVTEYMVNGSLRTALQRNDKILDRRRCLLIAMDVAFGMEYLHVRNIVHFDLKSDNLLVNLRDPQRPICKVGDLGLSKVKCQTLISGGVRGTLPWMAPELLYGSSSLVSEKVDVFSFGIVMWELLTGEEPYADLHYGTIIGGIVSNTLRPPVPDSCDPEWRALMEKCWSADPSERPSFTEVAERLRSVAASLPQKGRTHAQAQK